MIETAIDIHVRPNIAPIFGYGPGEAKLLLRGRASDDRFRAAAEQVLGVPLPGPGRSNASQDIRVLWHGLDSWLILTGKSGAPLLNERLSRALQPNSAAVIEMSANWHDIRIAGPRSRDILAKGCPLDLDASFCSPGYCARTRLGPFSIFLHQVDSVPTFDIYVGRSYASALWAWLEDAAREFNTRS